MWNLMLSSNLLKSKIPMLGVGGFTEFDAEFKFAQIQSFYFHEPPLPPPSPPPKMEFSVQDWT